MLWPAAKNLVFFRIHEPAQIFGLSPNSHPSKRVFGGPSRPDPGPDAGLGMAHAAPWTPHGGPPPTGRPPRRVGPPRRGPKVTNRREFLVPTHPNAFSGGHTAKFQVSCSVCVSYCSTYYKVVRVGGWGETREDMCYEGLRAEACVD
jgi:hypothetical protein